MLERTKLAQHCSGERNDQDDERTYCHVSAVQLFIKYKIVNILNEMRGYDRDLHYDAFNLNNFFVNFFLLKSKFHEF